MRRGPCVISTLVVPLQAIPERTQKLLESEADADAAIREAKAVQIELLEETDALKSELLQQRLLVHRLTSYQDE